MIQTKLFSDFEFLDISAKSFFLLHVYIQINCISNAQFVLGTLSLQRRY